MIVIIEIVNVTLTEKLCMLKMTSTKKISLTGGRDLKPINRQNALQRGEKKKDRRGKSCLITRFSHHLQYSLLPGKGWKSQIQGQQTQLFIYFKATESQLDFKAWHLKYAYLKREPGSLQASLGQNLVRILHVNNIIIKMSK